MISIIPSLDKIDNFQQLLQILRIPSHISTVADSLATYYGDNSQELKLLLLLISIKTETGNFCLIMPTNKDDFLNDVYLTMESITSAKQHKNLISKYFIKLFESSKKIVEDNNQIFGYDGDYKPVIMTDKAFYFFRWFMYEKNINAFLQKRINPSLKSQDCKSIDNIIELTVTHAKQASDFQLTSSQISALKLALKNNLTIITGGPGTGKTTIIINILRSLLYANNNNSLSIFLAAPTGKAASKLIQSIQTATNTENAKSLSDQQKQIDSKLPEISYTLHRLLYQKLKIKPYYSAVKEELYADVLVIDESSMIPIDIFAKLIEIIPDHCKIILIGDKNQLPAVNSISIFNNLIPDKNAPLNELKDIIVRLTETKRANKDIVELTNAIENNDCKWLNHFLDSCSKRDNHSNNIDFRNSKDSPINNILKTILDKNLKEIIASFPYEIELINKSEKEQNQLFKVIFTIFNNFKILCITNEGRYGIQEINAICKKLSRKGADNYHLHPIMITENDYPNSLLNGDQGVIIRIKGIGLKAFFATETGFRSISLFKLKNYTFSYAVTIHKSQGSEYKQILLILPDEEIKIMTKQLIYTGITRAKENVIIYGKEQIFLSTINCFFNNNNL